LDWSSYLQVLKKLVLELGQVSSLERESCQMSKHRVPYLLRVNKMVHHSFKLVHFDIWGPCPVSSTLGFKYFNMFVDGFSRVTWLYLMKNRSEALSIFQTFYNEIKNQFNMPVHLCELIM